MDLKKPASQTTGGGVAVGKTLIVGNLTAGVEKALPHGFTNFTDMQLEAKDNDNNQLIDLLWHDATNVYIRASVDIPSSSNLVISCIPYKYASVAAPAATATLTPSSNAPDVALPITIDGVNTNFQAGDTVASDGTASEVIVFSSVVIVSTTQITCVAAIPVGASQTTRIITVTSSPNVTANFVVT